MANWIVQSNGVSSGTVSATNLKRMVASGEINRSTLLRREGADVWTPAEKIKGLFPEADGPNVSKSLQPTSYSPTRSGSSASPEVIAPFGTQAEAVITNPPAAYTKAFGNQQSTIGKRRYRVIEIYAAALRIIAGVIVVCGILAAIVTVAFDPKLLDSIALAFGLIIGSAFIAFSLLLSSQMLKLVLDIAGDIKQIANRSQ
jgi:hypothetical protein